MPSGLLNTPLVVTTVRGADGVGKSARVLADGLPNRFDILFRVSYVRKVAGACEGNNFGVGQHFSKYRTHLPNKRRGQLACR